MQLPLDVKAVLDAALGIDEDACEPVSVGIIIDDTAPADLAAHVRTVFASAAPYVRVTIGYLESGAFFASSDDVAVIVGGLDERIGQKAAQARALGVPTMVVTTLPSLVDAIAREGGAPIPAGDIVAPAVAVEGSSVAERARASEASRGVGALAQRIAGAAAGREAGSFAGAMAAAMAGIDPIAFDAEPFALDESAARSLDERMGEWIIETRRDKRLAMARAFPFVRRPLALETVHATAVQNAAVGAAAFIPGADLPLMTLNQAKMLLKIAAVYGEPMDAARVKEIAFVVASAFAWRSLARSAAGVLPVIGWAVKGAVGYAGTLTLGHAAIEYFSGGGGIAGLAEATSRAGAAASRAFVGVEALISDAAGAFGKR